MKQDFFIRIAMEEECDLNAQFLCILLREQVSFKKCSIYPHFLHYMNCSKNHLKSFFSSTFSCLSSSTIQEKSNKPKQKGNTCLKNLQHSPEWQNHRKEEQISFKIFAVFSRMIKTQKRGTSDWKNWFHYIKWHK